MSGSWSLADVRAAKHELVQRYLQPGDAASAMSARALPGRVLPGPGPLANVVGIGVGEKIVDHQLASEAAVKVYVLKKYPLAEMTDRERIPATLAGIPTDVEEVGRIRARLLPCSTRRRQRQRPAPCGISVGHVGITAGSIGAVVRDSGRTDNGRRYILSNNHVLANSNAAQLGDAILQPGPLDGGVPGDEIAALSRFPRLDFAGRDNRVDAAIAEFQDGAILPEICAVGPVRGTIAPGRNMTVLKHGRTIGLTRGVITDTEADIRVDYDEAGVAFFINTVVIQGVAGTTPFSAGGDSGSLIVDHNRRACALLFAGSTSHDFTFANPIGAVLRRLRIRLL